MKELIASLLIVFGITPTIEAIPPQMNDEGLCYHEVIYNTEETETAEDVICEATTAYNEADAVALAKMLYGEARGCDYADQYRCCVTACNRADDSRWANTPGECVAQESQYYGYSADNPVLPELYDVAVEVLIAWAAYHAGENSAWEMFNCFTGDGTSNHFYTI